MFALTPTTRASRVALLGVIALSAMLTAVSSASAQRRGDRDRRRDWPRQHRRSAPEFALEASGNFTTLRGNPLGDVADGTGFEGMASIGAGMFSVGGGYQRAWHGRADNASDAVVHGFFIEPRFALPFAQGNFTPYLLGRAARLTRQPTDGGALLPIPEPEIKGTALGAGAGTLLWLANNVQLNTAVTWQDTRFDRATSIQGSGFGERVGGSQWTLRVGLAVGFDRWGR